MTARKKVKPPKPAVYMIAIIIVGMVCGAGFAMLEDATNAGWISSNISLFAITALAVVLMVAAVGFGARWMKSIDEAAQEAHKWSWYWGGSIGMAVGMALILIGNLPQTAALRMASWYGERSDPAAYMATGAIGIVGLMMVGYLLAWALWWFQRR